MKEYKLGEGLLKKGGLGSKPITPAPPAPKGQGGRASVAKATGSYVAMEKALKDMKNILRQQGIKVDLEPQSSKR